MSIYSYMVVKNEADRYLDACLQWLVELVDGVAVYDDRSTDDTLSIALDNGACVDVRSLDVPSFTTHEGRFRQAAWNFMERTFSPCEDDWILTVDADEFLVGVQDEVSELQALTSSTASAIEFQIPEVFKLGDDGQPYVRTDGFWRSITGRRLFRWQPDGLIADRPMASGSAPTYVATAPAIRSTSMFLLHYGYATAEDQLFKYRRYSELDHGHSSKHIESIVKPPRLEAWEGPWTSVWRGRER